MIRFDKAINTYYLCAKEDDRFSKHTPFHGMCLNSTGGTRILCSHDGKVIVLGYCVDAYGEWADDRIADELAGLDPLVFNKAIDRLAGEFVIFVEFSSGEVRVYNDAISIIPIVYDSDRVASNEKFIAEEKGYAIASYMPELISGGYANRNTKPGCMTGYSEIHYLLANHYLDFDKGVSVRYFPRENLAVCGSETSFNALMDRVIFLETNILRSLIRLSPLRAGLTSGTDSRLLLAMMSVAIPDELRNVSFFTIDYGNLNDNKVSRMLSSNLSLKHSILEARKAPEALVSELARLLPEDENVEGDKLWSIYSQMPGFEFCLGGAIVDQIAKSGKFSDFPEWIITPTFCTAVFGHSSNVALKEMKKWYKGTKPKAYGYSMGDLDAWEFRCGRWIGVNAHPYALMGMPMFNSWNCREIIDIFCKIPRKTRAKKAIHKALISKARPDLLEIPFNGGAKPISTIRHVLTYLAKYYLAKVGVLRFIK